MSLKVLKAKKLRFMIKCVSVFLVIFILTVNQTVFAQKTISPPILKKVLGAGLIELAEGDHDIFNIAVSYTKEGSLKGHFNYKMIRKGSNIILTSESITSMEINNDTAIIQGVATQKIKGSTTEYSFTLIVKDGGEKPGSDKLSISIEGPNGFKHEVSEATIKGQIIIMNEIEIPSYNLRGGKLIVRSNSKIEKFLFYPDHGILNFTISGVHGTNGYMNITLKKETIDGQPVVTIDNKVVSVLIKSNETHHEIYFEYTHSIHEISIYGTETIPIPEFKMESLAILTISVFIVYTTIFLTKSLKKKIQ